MQDWFNVARDIFGLSPEPPLDPPGDPATVECSDCDGMGYTLDDTDTSREECGRCEGSGRRIITRREIDDIRAQERLDDLRGK